MLISVRASHHGLMVSQIVFDQFFQRSDINGCCNNAKKDFMRSERKLQSYMSLIFFQDSVKVVFNKFFDEFERMHFFFLVLFAKK